MKTTVGSLVEKIEEIESIIYNLQTTPDDATYGEIKTFELAVKHLEDYKEIIWNTKVEV